MFYIAIRHRYRSAEHMKTVIIVEKPSQARDLRAAIGSRFGEILPLAALKADPLLAGMAVCQRGSRLSITPVAAGHFARVCQLAGFSLKERRTPIRRCP